MPPESSAPLILCIDDHENGLQIRRMLLERSGYRVLTALTGADGLRELKQADGSVNLVITDYFLPDMSGDLLAQKVKSMRPGLPVMMLTGSAMEPTGGPWIDAFLMKGGSTEELLTLIGRMLQKAA